MRSSNKRSRSKNNRNRPSGGNIVNRVFDSSGPEGKVRGTPQQIIDKYNQLTRDAQLSNDRVAAENFAQHAEHYTRMLAEAQREMDQRRDQADQQNRDRQQQDGQENPNRNDGNRSEAPRKEGSAQPETEIAGGGDANERPQAEAAAEQSPPEKPKRARRAPNKPREDDVIDTAGEREGSGLVETPESQPKRRTRKPRPAKSAEDGEGSDNDGGGSDDTAQAAE